MISLSLLPIFFSAVVAADQQGSANPDKKEAFFNVSKESIGDVQKCNQQQFKDAQAYSSDTILNDARREKTKNLFPKLKYFCDSEKIAAGVRDQIGENGFNDDLPELTEKAESIRGRMSRYPYINALFHRCRVIKIDNPDQTSVKLSGDGALYGCARSDRSSLTFKEEIEQNERTVKSKYDKTEELGKSIGALRGEPGQNGEMAKLMDEFIRLAIEADKLKTRNKELKKKEEGETGFTPYHLVCCWWW